MNPRCAQTIEGLAGLKAALEGSQLLVATAESCTGGQLAALFASDVELGPCLERGYIVYSLDAKCDMLGVERVDAERNDGVNPEVARAMADSAFEQGRADVAVSVTGFCGPPQHGEEVGLVYIATVSRLGLQVEEHHLGDMGREEVLASCVDAAVVMLTDAILKLRQSG